MLVNVLFLAMFGLVGQLLQAQAHSMALLQGATEGTNTAQTLFVNGKSEPVVTPILVSCFDQTGIYAPQHGLLLKAGTIANEAGGPVVALQTGLFRVMVKAPGHLPLISTPLQIIAGQPITIDLTNPANLLPSSYVEINGKAHAIAGEAFSDANSPHQIDALDYSRVLDLIATLAYDPEADFNFDGKVNSSDLNIAIQAMANLSQINLP